jgi:hypothetical protein
LVRLPGVSLLGQLRQGLGKLASRVLRRVQPSTYTSPETDIESVSARLRRVSTALRMLKR